MECALQGACFSYFINIFAPHEGVVIPILYKSGSNGIPYNIIKAFRLAFVAMHELVEIPSLPEYASRTALKTGFTGGDSFDSIDNLAEMDVFSFILL